ncbi:unnamed protein product [Chrysoparadoxa australica]
MGKKRKCKRQCREAEVEPEEDEELNRLRERAEREPSSGEEAADTIRRDDEGEQLARLRRGADMEPSCEEEGAGWSEEDEELNRLRGRAEMAPSDDDDTGGEEEEEEGRGSFHGRARQEYSSSSSEGDSYGSDSENEEEKGEDEGQEEEGASELPLATRVLMRKQGSGVQKRQRDHSKDRERRKALAAVKEQLRQGKPGTGTGKSTAVAEGPETQTNHKRANKNRPAEMSSKKAVGRYREVIEPTRKKGRDPRFAGHAGKASYNIFRKSYAFLDEYQDREIAELQKGLKKEKDKTRAGEMKRLLGKMQQERSERQRADQLTSVLQEKKRAERKAVAEGKNPFFLKGSEKRKIALELRYNQLKEDGKLRKFVEKKRKRNSQKDRRWLPRDGRELGRKFRPT